MMNCLNIKNKVWCLQKDLIIEILKRMILHERSLFDHFTWVFKAHKENIFTLFMLSHTKTKSSID